jgi:splicing factor 3B subunit 3
VFAIIPRRVGTDINASVIITSAVTLKQKKSFFFLLQSDLGDVYALFHTTPSPPVHIIVRYRVALEQDGDTVAAINMHYFETLPVAASMAVLRSGYLFVATEMAAHRLCVRPPFFSRQLLPI